VEVEGWFTEDFTLAELKTLRARERIPELRPQNARHDGEFSIPTLQEILQLLAQVNVARHAQGQQSIGVYPETKHPSHFAALGLALEPLLLGALDCGAKGAPVYIQSFEVGNLQALREQCDYPLVQLMALEGGPWDLASATGSAPQRWQYRNMAARDGLKSIARYAQAIGVQKEMVMRAAEGSSPAPASLVQDAHAAALKVHVWTFRAENHFLPAALRRGTEPSALGDLAAEIDAFVAAGIDGLFSDQPALARAALQRITSS
jgi:glycerophosphoryl diester phosphodiesterase